MRKHMNPAQLSAAGVPNTVTVLKNDKEPSLV